MSQTMAAAKPSKPKKLDLNAYPWYSMRFWHGLRLGDWLALLVRHRFRIHPARWAMAILITPCTIFNTCAAALQRLRFGKLIADTKIEEPPIFIIGHWRSGTTHLHELLVLDERFGYPTTYQCMAPHHFILTEWFFTRFGNWLIPDKRPMDNMATGWGRPQEDEFALMILGQPTMYTRIAFANDPPEFMETLNFNEVSQETRRTWGTALRTFVQAVTYKHKKRIVLKSPPHTGRIAELARLFPGAKFIHIARNPLEVVPSTLRLWPSLDDVQGFQFPKNKQLRELVFSSYEIMYRGYEAQRGELSPQQLYELRYEELVRDPVGEVRKIYETLALGDFEPVREKLEAYMQGQKDYVKNRHDVEPELKAEIATRWREYIERYGYQDEVGEGRRGGGEE